MIKFVHEENVSIVVPTIIAANLNHPLGQKAYELLVADCPHATYVLPELDLEVIQVRINMVEDVFLRQFIGILQQDIPGFDLYWTPGQIPKNEAWVQITKDKLVPELDNDKKLENDTHYLIPIRVYDEHGNRPLIDAEILKTWATAYADEGYTNFYSEPKNIEALKANFPQPEIV